MIHDCQETLSIDSDAHLIELLFDGQDHRARGTAVPAPDVGKHLAYLLRWRQILANVDSVNAATRIAHEHLLKARNHQRRRVLGFVHNLSRRLGQLRRLNESKGSLLPRILSRGRIPDNGIELIGLLSPILRGRRGGIESLREHGVLGNTRVLDLFERLQDKTTILRANFYSRPVNVREPPNRPRGNGGGDARGSL
jgi:hypothetical protein